MSENEVDPAGNTQQFQAFVQKDGGESVQQQPKSNLGVIIAAVAAIVVVIAGAVFALR
jgi:hypothetical protein